MCIFEINYKVKSLIPKLKQFLSYCFIFIGFSLFAQDYQLNIKFEEQAILSFNYKWKKSYTDSTAVVAELTAFQQKAIKKGYINCSLDSIVYSNLNCMAYIFLGKPFTSGDITNGNLPDGLWKGIQKKQKKNPNTSVELLLQYVQQYYGNRGYPLAESYLENIQLTEQAIQAELWVDSGDYVIMDSIVVHGDTKTKAKFMKRYLGFTKDDFNWQKIKSISKKIDQLPYLREAKPAELVFFPGETVVHLFLEKQRSNQFNLVLGVLPNDQLDNGKVTITGDGKLHLLNSFGVGEEIFAEFRQLKPRTQELDIALSYPFLLHSPIGLFSDFNLYKNDSLFLEVNFSGGLQYHFSWMNSLQFYYENQSSSIIQKDTIAIKNTGELPDILDNRINRYGFRFNTQQLDYVLNPRKGFLFSGQFGVGSAKIKVNQAIANLKDAEGVELREKYEELDLQKINYQVGFEMSYFIPIKKRSTFLLKNSSAAFIAQNILTNEKYRIGGNRLLRGFDEEAIYTPYYSVFTTEFRYLLSRNSYFNVFFDGAIVENEQKGSGAIDIPIGFGSGIALETKGGIFSLSYALGKNLDNKIQFKNGKIHFGFVSLF